MKYKAQYTPKMFNLLMLYNEINTQNPIHEDSVYGIYKHAHPETYQRIMNIIDMSPSSALDYAINFYYNEYYSQLSCNEIYDESLILNLIDIAYNFQSKHTALILLQKSINELLNKKVVELDGVLGDVMRHELSKIDQHRLNEVLIDIRKSHTSLLLRGRPLNEHILDKMIKHADQFH
jgi:hypothetical protein